METFTKEELRILREIAMDFGCQRPIVGWLCIEMSSPNDPEAVGILREEIWNTAHPEQYDQPSDCFLKRVQSLVNGETKNWDNCQFYRLPCDGIPKELDQKIEQLQEMVESGSAEIAKEVRAESEQRVSQA